MGCTEWEITMAKPQRKSLLELFADAERDPEVRAEKAAINVIEQAFAILKVEQINQKELADKMGVRPPAVSRMLHTPPNMTFATFYRLAEALGTAELAEITLDKKRFPACLHLTRVADGVRHEDWETDRVHIRTLPYFHGHIH
jgi:transcriptional regulator with XRE-family HTH domain